MLALDHSSLLCCYWFLTPSLIVFCSSSFEYHDHLLYSLLAWLLSGYTCMMNWLWYLWLTVVRWLLLWQVAVNSSQSTYGWLLWFKSSRYWDHLVIWFWLLVSTRGSFSYLVMESWLYSYSSRRLFMILEWTFYLEAQALNAEEFLTTSMKAQKIFLSDMIEGWRW